MKAPPSFNKCLMYYYNFLLLSTPLLLSVLWRFASLCSCLPHCIALRTILCTPHYCLGAPVTERVDTKGKQICRGSRCSLIDLQSLAIYPPCLNYCRAEKEGVQHESQGACFSFDKLARAPINDFTVSPANVAGHNCDPLAQVECGTCQHILVLPFDPLTHISKHTPTYI